VTHSSKLSENERNTYANAEQLYLSAPAIAIVEAKKEDIIGGLGQCIATLYAASIFNQRENNPIPCIYGASLALPKRWFSYQAAIAGVQALK